MSHIDRRQPHAVLDLPSRRWKALKISQLLALNDRPQPIRLLEIGTGSGGIAHFFGTSAEPRCEVVAVDVRDSRLVTDGYTYLQVQGVELPFDDASFDVVITNHVIEHVGNSEAQHRHLREVRRVLKHGGVGYLAVPNRWMLVEPHYRLMFLSWLPRTWRTPYLKLMSRGAQYDCEPLQKHEIERLLTAAELAYESLTVAALRATFSMERPDAVVTRLLPLCPDRLLRPLVPVIPTLIYRVTRAA